MCSMPTGSSPPEAPSSGGFCGAALPRQQGTNGEGGDRSRHDRRCQFKLLRQQDADQSGNDRGKADDAPGTDGLSQLTFVNDGGLPNALPDITLAPQQPE